MWFPFKQSAVRKSVLFDCQFIVIDKLRAINLSGSMRYGNVFGEAIRLVSSGRIDLRPLVNDVLPLAEISRAMDLAADKNQALKVQLTIP
jgi:threonine dehydrogenase-like Zn-dependent dehydrogenase